MSACISQYFSVYFSYCLQKNIYLHNQLCTFYTIRTNQLQYNNCSHLLPNWPHYWARARQQENLNCILLASSLFVSFSKSIGGESQSGGTSDFLIQLVLRRIRRERTRGGYDWDLPIFFFFQKAAEATMERLYSVAYHPLLLQAQFSGGCACCSTSWKIPYWLFLGECACFDNSFDCWMWFERTPRTAG